MEDILKSGIFGIALLGTLIFSAPILNDDDNTDVVAGSERMELKIEKDIHIPLQS